MIPQRTTERLLLRPFRRSDAHDYAAQIYSDPAVMRYMTADGRAKDAAPLYAAQVIERRLRHWAATDYRYGGWAVVERTSGALMGHVGLFDIEDSGDVEVGYALGQAYWGKGYATEAARDVLAYGFDVVQLDVIHGLAFPPNTPSLHVMHKLGMTRQPDTTRYYGEHLAHCIITRAAYRAQSSR